MYGISPYIRYLRRRYVPSFRKIFSNPQFQTEPEIKTTVHNTQPLLQTEAKDAKLKPASTGKGMRRRITDKWNRSTKILQKLKPGSRSTSSGTSANNVNCGDVGETVGPPRYIYGFEELQSLIPEFDVATTNGTHLVSVGGGPRATTQALAEMQLLMERHDDLEAIGALGGKYDMCTTIIERQPADWLGRGTAWGNDQGEGMVNTGAETSGLGYPERLAAFYTRNYDRFRKEYAQNNPVAATMQIKAFTAPLGTPSQPAVEQSMGTRRHQGKEEPEHFEATWKKFVAMQETCRVLLGYKLSVFAQTEVSHVDISTDPAVPRVILKSMVSGDEQITLPAATVRLNTGTTLVSPIEKKDVQERSFTQLLDTKKLKAFLHARNSLDADGKLKPGVKLALGGSGLSAIDEAQALQCVMDLMETDESSLVGHKVSESAKVKYKGAITFISNREGKWIPPRHAHTPEWTQAIDPLGTPEMQHAAFLHGDGKEIFNGAWSNVVDASIALASGITQGEVGQRGLTTKDLLARQFKSTLGHAKALKEAEGLSGAKRQEKLTQASRTLEGARRQGYFSTILGLGMARDIPSAVEKMESRAPLTFAGRGNGYPMHRAQLMAISRPGSEVAKNNAPLLARSEAYMADITSSPWPIHAQIPMLMEAGIIEHLAGSYDELKVDGSDGRLTFTANNGEKRKFDAFIVSPVMQRSAEPAITSLNGQVMPVDPALPDLGEVTLNRMLKTHDGQKSHVEDYGLNGKGAFIPGTKSKVGIFATDVNNRESAESVAQGLALRRLAQAHLAAAGIEDPVGAVEKMYEELLPEDDAFDKEVKSFEADFDELMAMDEYLKAAKETADTDGEFFGAMAEKARTPASRKSAATVARKIRENNLRDPENQDLINRYVETLERYEAGLQTVPKFSPTTNMNYQKRFVDAPISMHETVYQRAFEMAVSRCQAESQKGKQPQTD